MSENRKKRRTFTPAEDVRLCQLVQIHGTDKWDTISSFMDSRTARQCRERYRAFLAPTISNGPWTREEDELLKTLFIRYGPKWSTIVKYFKGRSDCNVKNRWSQFVRLQTTAPSDDAPQILLPVTNAETTAPSQMMPKPADNFNSEVYHDIDDDPFASNHELRRGEDEFQLNFEDMFDSMFQDNAYAWQ